MDCCRSSIRLGGADVKVVVRSGFAEMKASSWEKEDAIHEGIPILNYHVPKAFLHKKGKLTGMTFEKVAATTGRKRPPRSRRRPASRTFTFACDDVLIAVGQENAFPWIEADSGVAFDRAGLPKLDPLTFQSSLPRVFFGGDSAFGPKNIITAVAHGHEAAISIDAFCRGESPTKRPPPMTNLVSQKMGIHEWSYDNAIALDRRFKVPHNASPLALKNIHAEVELGFDPVARGRRGAALPQLRRADGLLRARLHRMRRLRRHLPARLHLLRAERAGRANCAFRSTRRPPIFPRRSMCRSRSRPAAIMAKDEDLCLHCGLCAERCPTGAWDMQKFTLEMAQAGHSCRSRA